MFVEECSYEPVPASEPRELQKVPDAARNGGKEPGASKTPIERAGLTAGLAVDTRPGPAFSVVFFKMGLKESVKEKPLEFPSTR